MSDMPITLNLACLLLGFTAANTVLLHRRFARLDRRLAQFEALVDRVSSSDALVIRGAADGLPCPAGDASLAREDRRT